jgi:epoxyqueuosine reductase
MIELNWRKMNPLLKNEAAVMDAWAIFSLWAASLKAIAHLVYMGAFEVIPGQFLKRSFARQIKQGKMIWLDDLEFSRSQPDAQQQWFSANEIADLTPGNNFPPRKSRAVLLDAYPEPKYPFAYRCPPLSGNVIN